MELGTLTDITGELTPTTIGALTVALTQIIKKWLPVQWHDKWCPIIAIAIAMLLVFQGYGISQATIIQGFIIGLTSTGLYGAAKDVIGGEKMVIRE